MISHGGITPYHDPMINSTALVYIWDSNNPILESRAHLLHQWKDGLSLIIAALGFNHGTVVQDFAKPSTVSFVVLGMIYTNNQAILVTTTYSYIYILFVYVIHG